MRTGKEFVERLTDLTGHEPDWVLFPNEENDVSGAFSTATFVDVYSETIAALMPLDAADDRHFNIEVSSVGIKITVFCEYEDAPAAARRCHNG